MPVGSRFLRRPAASRRSAPRRGPRCSDRLGIAARPVQRLRLGERAVRVEADARAAERRRARLERVEDPGPRSRARGVRRRPTSASLAVVLVSRLSAPQPAGSPWIRASRNAPSGGTRSAASAGSVRPGSRPAGTVRRAPRSSARGTSARRRSAGPPPPRRPSRRRAHADLGLRAQQALALGVAERGEHRRERVGHPVEVAHLRLARRREAQAGRAAVGGIAPAGSRARRAPATGSAVTGRRSRGRAGRGRRAPSRRAPISNSTRASPSGRRSR